MEQQNIHIHPLIAITTFAMSLQGAKVRELKSQKAEKAAIDVEVSLLLDLKKKLSLAEGKSSDADKKSGMTHY